MIYLRDLIAFIQLDNLSSTLSIMWDISISDLTDFVSFKNLVWTDYHQLVT